MQTAVPPYIQEWAVIFSPHRHLKSIAGGGTYTLVNNGVTADQAAGEFDRSGMVPAFGDVGFRISLNEVALAEHDDKTSPFGWHVIKRVK